MFYGRNIGIAALLCLSLLGFGCGNRAGDFDVRQERVGLQGQEQPLAESNASQPPRAGQDSPQAIQESAITIPGDGAAEAEPQVMPHRIKVLPVPFATQAPHANWDMPYQEACEEASLIMVNEYVQGNKTLRLDRDYMDAEILKLIAWEEGRGSAPDLDASQVTAIAESYFGLAVQVAPYDPERIRQAILKRQAVILPAAGKLLGNPNFRNGGPRYHMLVVRGYEGDEFITNDPGTRNGESYRYHESVFARAVHDWNGGDVANGEQVMLLVSGTTENAAP